ncbi:MAG: hypothetical protein NC190_00900 [Bacteroides sp.]|nr:hypothetical protein [Bacteroides sp.]
MNTPCDKFRAEADTKIYLSSTTITTTACGQHRQWDRNNEVDFAHHIVDTAIKKIGHLADHVDAERCHR